MVSHRSWAPPGWKGWDETSEWRWGEWRECGLRGLLPVVVTPFGQLLSGPTTTERLRFWRDCTPCVQCAQGSPHLTLHQEPPDYVPWPWKPMYGASFFMCACLISQILQNVDAKRPFCLSKLEAYKLKI